VKSSEFMRNQKNIRYALKFFAELPFFIWRALTAAVKWRT